MKRTTRSGIILGLWLLFGGGMILASDGDEIRQRAKAMLKEASEMAEKGNREQASRLKKESAELLASAERLELKTKRRTDEVSQPEIEKEARLLKERHRDLLATLQKMKAINVSESDQAEVLEQIARTAKELHSMQTVFSKKGEHSPEFQAQVEKLEAAARRIQHIRVAAENLKMAEVHDLAQQLMERAASMERETQEAKKRLASEMQTQERGDRRPDDRQEMRSEIERLRAEVKELREKVEHRR